MNICHLDWPFWQNCEGTNNEISQALAGESPFVPGEPLNPDNEIMNELSPKAFRLYASHSPIEANKLLFNLFNTGSAEKKLLGMQYLTMLENNMLSYLYCDSEEMAIALKFNDNEWELTKQLKDNYNNICISELTTNGKIELRNIIGPISIPFRETKDLDLSHSSELNFPLLTNVFGNNLTISHTSGLKFPALEMVHGTLWAPHSINTKFQRIESIGGDLIITNVKNIVFNSLSRVDGNVKTNRAENIEFPQLVRIHGKLDVGNGKNIKAPMLNHVGSLAKKLDAELFAPQLPKRPMKIPYLPT